MLPARARLEIRQIIGNNPLADSIMAAMDYPNIPGSVFFVDSTQTASQLLGSIDQPFLTTAAAVAAAEANNGDHIFLMPTHAETISAAGGITIDKAGLTIVPLGNGTNRPTLTFGTAVGASLLITGANTRIRNGLLCISALDALTNPIHIQASDCEIDVTWRDSADDVEAVRAVLTTAAADRLNLRLVYEGRTGGNGVVNAVRLVGVDKANIDVDFYGVASTAVVEFITTACTNIQVTGRIHNSGVTTGAKNVVDTQGSSTWSAMLTDVVAGMTWVGGSSVSYGGFNPILGKRVNRTTADVITGSAVPIFTVAGGRVLLTCLIGKVTTVIGAGASNAKFQFNPTTGTTVDMCANLDIDADEAGTLYSIDGTPATAMLTSQSGAVRNMQNQGIILDIGDIEFLGGTDRTGSISFQAWYIPLDDGATLVAA
jgi:hypothetical protein